jgi:hypothetical protein
VLAKNFPEVPIWTEIKRLTTSSIFDWMEVCQDLGSLVTMRRPSSTNKGFQFKTSQNFTKSVVNACTASCAGAEPFSGLNADAVHRIISTVEQGQLIVPRTFLNELLSAAQSSAAISVNVAGERDISKMAEAQFKPTTTTMTDLLKFIGSVSCAITNGTNTTKQKEHNGTRRVTIDLVTGGFP